MLKIDFIKTYGEDDYKVKWSITGRGEKCIKLTQTCDDDGDIDTFDFFIPNNNIILETENTIFFRSCESFNKVDKTEREYIESTREEELEIAKKS